MRTVLESLGRKPRYTTGCCNTHMHSTAHNSTIAYNPAACLTLVARSLPKRPACASVASVKGETCFSCVHWLVLRLGGQDSYLPYLHHSACCISRCLLPSYCKQLGQPPPAPVHLTNHLPDQNAKRPCRKSHESFLLYPNTNQQVGWGRAQAYNVCCSPILRKARGYWPH